MLSTRGELGVVEARVSCPAAPFDEVGSGLRTSADELESPGFPTSRRAPCSDVQCRPTPIGEWISAPGRLGDEEWNEDVVWVVAAWAFAMSGMEILRDAWNHEGCGSRTSALAPPSPSGPRS